GQRSTLDFHLPKLTLLTSRKGNSSQYPDYDFSDQFMVEIKLIKANLSNASLSNANLSNADLRCANLSNVKANGTDFRHAKLTGACLQNWSINPATQFDHVECEYVYLSPEQQPSDRRPLSGNFKPGDFEKLVDKFADTLDFILRQGIDPATFRQALSHFCQGHPAAKIERIIALDDQCVLVQVTVPATTNKVAAYISFHTKLTQLNQHPQAVQAKTCDLKSAIPENQSTKTLLAQLLDTSTPSSIVL
ncbi:MAG: pentapeptide repeat-containing protein, partial [Synechococcales bacterium]|nr:pentapeptide repeat-containing protein [Synechococcales bacterium]